ncbi:MAG TPA: DUF3788 family protein [Terracidiphilus sp.]|jgi:hypothetical protein|nr:DUF3788 family protein [Terracidiphilus sp.]
MDAPNAFAPNAFIGKPDRPSDAEVAAVLGPAASLWTELIDQVTADAGQLVQEWQGVYVNKYGWSLRLKKKGRNIIFLAPCNGCFRVAFALSDKAVKAAGEAHPPKKVASALATAPHYPEGTGLRLTVRSPRDLPAIRKIAQIKLVK